MDLLMYRPESFNYERRIQSGLLSPTMAGKGQPPVRPGRKPLTDESKIDD